VGRAPLTFRRLSGLDRSGPPPPETQAGAPLRPWTIPNAIGYLRAALIPTFLVLALTSDDGTDALPATLFAIVAWGDYADGIAARVTRQYSRMGALMDPVIDRALVIAGVIVCWKFVLLPRWMLGVMVGRELFMLVAGQYALRHGATLKINWFGRWSVWPVMSALMMGLVALKTAGTVALAIGLVLALLATVQYGRDAVRELRAT
jgi:CDP-diacylglycerol---glycerol-3-phosphate 3-phosphatidyltransferase